MVIVANFLDAFYHLWNLIHPLSVTSERNGCYSLYTDCLVS